MVAIPEGGFFMTTPYRADHIGSLLRPPELLQARAAYDQGRMTLPQLRQSEDTAILQALELQRQVGIDVYTDGEYRRRWFAAAFEESVEGITEDPEAAADRRWQGQHNAQAMATAADLRLTQRVVGAKLRQVRRLTAHESGFLQEHAPGPFKITMPGVMTRALAWYKPGLTDKFYPTRADLVQEFVGMIQREVQALLNEGVSYIQLDSLHYVIRLADPRYRQQMTHTGADLDKELDEVIAADNASLQGARKSGVTVGLHMCRGNNRSAWISEGGYEAVAEKAFNLLDVDRFLLEYDTERAGGFEPLRFVPRGKTVVLGLISSKVPQLESPDQLRRRIDEAAQYVAMEHLALSPQCGFASTAPGNMLTWDDQRRKLELVVETARRVWGA
jgi:5-methyltetrahydropteroyltriglutamate--homocysteine methyltransferase